MTSTIQNNSSLKNISLNYDDLKSIINGLYGNFEKVVEKTKKIHEEATIDAYQSNKDQLIPKRISQLYFSTAEFLYFKQVKSETLNNYRQLAQIPRTKHLSDRRQSM